MRRCFPERFTLLNIACIEQENNIGDDFTEDVRTFFMSDFLSTFGPFQDCRQY